ncbi:MAG: redoxin domain-containing protein [Firmicutes bacterium]|nr:redoxin domain-containing protein [Bacillota bacterium]
MAIGGPLPGGGGWALGRWGGGWRLARQWGGSRWSVRRWRALMAAGLLALVAGCGGLRAPAGPGPGQEPPGPGSGAESPEPAPVRPRPRPEVGEPAPDWQGVDVRTGKPLAGADLRGKVVLLNFFATWCGPCRTEMPDLERLAAEAGDAVAVVAIGADPTESPEQLAAFARSLGVTFPVVHDGGRAALAYLATGIPTSYFVDREGILRVRFPGPMNLEQMRQLAAQAGATLPAGEAEPEQGEPADPGGGPASRQDVPAPASKPEGKAPAPGAGQQSGAGAGSSR